MLFGKKKVKEVKSKMISSTLNKIIEEELKGADLATKITRVSSGNVDEAMQQKPLKLPIKEVWRKTFPRTKEEIESYNKGQEWFAHRNRSYRYEYRGDNIVDLAIVPYEGGIPNGYVQIPEGIFSPHSNDQQQIILGEEGIIFRELQDFRPNGKIRALNQTVLGEISGDDRYAISKSYKAILKSTIRDILQEPNDFLHDWWSSKYKEDDHYFPIVALVPETHLSLDKWWKENERHYRNSFCPNKSDWNDVPLIYATILRPELEKQGYVLEARE